MDFFKSVFSDEPSPSGSEPDSPDPPPDTKDLPGDAPFPATDADSPGGGAWSFGGFMKTIAARSESVMEHYRHDIEEFKSGLRKETEVIREAASRAVKDLPASLEVGASVAQDSLESVGQAIDDIGATVWSSTAQIISHGKDALRDLDLDSVGSEGSWGNAGSSSHLHGYGLDGKKYSRFDAQLNAIQSDVDTFFVEPEDMEDYGAWKLEFVLEKSAEEIESLIKENEIIGDIYDRVVPDIVDRENFWSRYFYRVHKLKQAEEARARLVQRAISGEEDEDLRWDFDDDDNDVSASKGGSSVAVDEDKEQRSEAEEKSSGAAEEASDDNSEGKKIQEASDDNSEGKKTEEKEKSEGSSKDSDMSIVSMQPSTPEEDLGWDEIEDVVSNDGGKGDAVAGGTNRVELRKRLGAADEEEDLSWDIEDDDNNNEPSKAQ